MRLLDARGGRRDLLEWRGSEVGSGFWEIIDASVPIAVELRGLQFTLGVHQLDLEKVASLIAARMCRGDPAHAMQRLMNVADEVDDETQRLRFCFVIGA